MGYDLRRAALLTLSLCALLLAASLMPAAGLGSFPSMDGGDEAGPGPAAQPSSNVDTPTSTSTATPTPTPTQTQTETGRSDTPTPTDSETETDDDERDEQGILFGYGVFGVVLVILGSLLFGTVGYVGFVGIVAVTLGTAAASKLPLGGNIRSLPQMTMATLIGLSGSLSSFARGFGGVIDGISAGLRELFAAPASLGSIFGSLLTIPASVGRGFSVGFSSVFGSLGGAFSMLGGSATKRSRAGEETGTTVDARDDSTLDPETLTPDEDDRPLSVVDAWDLMTDNLSVRGLHAKTPTEIGAEAIERGWPTEPVQQLTETFQEIRYGGKDVTSDRVETARNAIADLRDHWGESE